MEVITSLIVALPLGGFLFGGVIAYILTRPKAKQIEEAAQKAAQNTTQLAQREAERVRKEAEKSAQKIRKSAEREEDQSRLRMEKKEAQFEDRIAKREEVLETKIEKAEASREKYEQSANEFREKQKELQKKIGDQNEVLEKIARLSQDEAKNILFDRMEKEWEEELSITREKKVEAMRKDADEEASNILVQAIQRFSSPVTAETTTSIVRLKSDDLKGKIIGREGRNINAFEMITGVDVIIDDSPGTVTLSCYDMYRRYVAKMTLEELLKDGRIQPASIEQAVEKAQENAEELLLDLGKKAEAELGLSGFPEEILKLLGRLRFRTSYGQNVLTHSIEVAWLAEAIAKQLPGADPEVCKKAGLVHDIGKAVSHEVAGGHALIGMEILEKFGIDKAIVDAMKSHHEDLPYESIEARIIQAADAISASRPGARRETLEKYIKRLKALEAVAGSFKSVKKAYAIQAGREVRVFVNAHEIDDKKTQKLSYEMARKIEKTCDYPGEVKVTVIREQRFVEKAR